METPKEWGWRAEYADKHADTDALDNALMQALYGFPVRRYRTALGLHWYLVDAEATKDGLKHLIGARWEKGYDDTGALVEFFGRLCPSPSRSREACAEAEVEIERRGLQHEYVGALTDLLGLDYTDHVREGRAGDLFPIITAPPVTRVQAMLAVLKED